MNQPMNTYYTCNLSNFLALNSCLILQHRSIILSGIKLSDRTYEKSEVITGWLRLHTAI